MLFSFIAELDPVHVADLKEGGKNKSVGLWTTLLRELGAGKYQMRQVSTVREKMVPWHVS